MFSTVARIVITMP